MKLEYNDNDRIIVVMRIMIAIINNNINNNSNNNDIYSTSKHTNCIIKKANKLR